MFCELGGHDGEIPMKALEHKGWMARMYLIPERMEVKWGGWWDFRVGKDRPCRVPPLLENEA